MNPTKKPYQLACVSYGPRETHQSYFKINDALLMSSMCLLDLCNIEDLEEAIQLFCDGVYHFIF